VSENRALRRTSEPKRDEVREGYRKLHNEELHNTQACWLSNTTIRLNKSRRMGCAGYIARMGENRNA
jgi:hypothetical protein